MNTYLKKAAIAAGAVCALAGAISVGICGAAIAAAAKGVKYGKDAVSKLMDDESKKDTVNTEESITPQEPEQQAEITEAAED